MKRLLAVVGILFSLCLSISCQQRFSPWGIWNDTPLNKSARIVDLSYGSFYQNGFEGIWILEDHPDVLDTGQPISAFVNLGEYNQIISYTEVQEGIVFIIKTERTKSGPEKGDPLFEYFDAELKMEFLSKNTCKFTYLNHEEINGFEFGSWGTIVRENVIYERFPVEDKLIESNFDE